MEELLKTNEIVGICEHWLSGPELHKLQISQSHNVFSKCNSDLLFNPPERGRGYGGVALYCNKSLSCMSINGIDSDRIIGLEVKQSCGTRVVLYVYMPNVNNEGQYTDVLITLNSIMERYAGQCDIVILGDFNVTLRGQHIFDERHQGVLDVMSDNGLCCTDVHNSHSGPNYTFHRDGIGKSCIDHVLISFKLLYRVAACGVID